MSDSSTFRRIDLMHAHGSPTGYLYDHFGCRCLACRGNRKDLSRRYRERNPDKVKSDQRAYYIDHREAVIARSLVSRANRPGCRIEEGKRYREKHKDDLRVRNAARRSANRSLCRERERAWSAKHPESMRVRRENYRARKRAAFGSHTASDIAAQRTRQHGLCFWCHKKVGKHYHVDHVTPLSLGGSNGPENLVIACAECNLSKGAKHPMDFAGMLL